MNLFPKQLKAKACSLLLLALVSACSQNVSPHRETVVSDLFNICTTVPDLAQLKRRTPIDTESIDYSDDVAAYDITLSHYPGDLSRVSGPPVSIGGPLNLIILGTESSSSGQRYVMQFDSIGAVSPHAYGSVRIIRNTKTEPDSMFSFLAGWRRCR